MLILKDLWIGNIDNGKVETRTHEFEIANKKYINGLEELYRTITPDLQEKLEALKNQESEIRIMEEYSAFVKGFRLGAKMMLDILGDYSLEETE